jgi:hypothetical protein
MERRKYPRIYCQIPIEFSLPLPEPSGEFLKGQGVLINFSQGGVYFRYEGPTPMEQGQVGDFVITRTQRRDYPFFPSVIRAKCRVVRLESSASNYCGVALEFLSSPMLNFRRD